MNLHRNHKAQLFSSARLGRGDFGLLRNEWKFVGLFLMSCLFWISSSKYRKLKFHPNTKQALCLATCLLSYPIFFSHVFFYDCSIFSSFLELKGQNAATSLHSGNNANNSFHFPRDGKSATLQGEGTLQYQGKHGSLESNLSRRTKSSFIVSSLL